MNLDPEVYSAEISPVDVCGPDLYDTDPAFAALLDSCEEMLPERFTDFDRAEIDFTDLFKQMDGFLKQSRDLRLLVLICQFSLLNGQLHQFANSARTIRRLLETHWDAVHPSDADIGFMERIGALEALNNRPTVILPLEEAPLLKTRRAGPISFRAIEIAAGNKTARSDEHTISMGAIEAALTSGELEQADIDAVLADLSELPEEFTQIASICETRLREAEAKAAPPSFDALVTMLQEMSSSLNRCLGRLEPEAVADDDQDVAEGGAPAEAATPAAAATDVANAAQAKLVLEAVEQYFASREPSHPALFLVREARGLVGRSFLDALKILMPRRFDDVSLLLGTSGLQLTNDRLQELNEGSSDDLGETDEFEVPQIDSRATAMRQVGVVKAYFTANEPTSPIPLLLEEAQNMSSGTFSNLLGLFLRPEDS